MANIIIGKVLSLKMQKTAVVIIERKFRHKLYKKTLIRHKKYKVHYDQIKLEMGDMVEIKGSRPISKDKHFVVVKKLNK